MVIFMGFSLVSRSENTLTRRMLIQTTILAFFGCLVELAFMANRENPDFSPGFKTVLYSLNLLMMFFCSMNFERYTFKYLTRNRGENRFYVVFNNVLVVVFVLTIAGNFKFNYLFHISADAIEYKGLNVFAAYVAPLIYLVIGLVGIAAYRSELNRREFYALIATHVIVLGGAIIEGVLNDTVMTVSFSITVGLYILYTFLEAPEYQRLLETNRRLVIAEDEAVKASRAKSNFLSAMSHEIRTPMNAVLGMNETTLRNLDDNGLSDEEKLARIRDNSDFIQKAGESLLNIINDILDISKIEAGKMEIVEAPYHIKELLDEVFIMFSYQAKKKGIEFKTSVDESLPGYVLGDVVRMRQVMTNVINNAVKYTEKGSVQVCFKGHEDGDRIVYDISISDTGMGIRKESMEHLFDAFSRIDNEETHFIEGTGLGLAIVKKILTLMGGSIEAKSEYQKGSVFTMHIPQKVLSDEKICGHITRSQTKDDEDTSVDISGSRVLVVDDNMVNIMVAANSLKEMSAEVDTAGSGSEALERIKERKYDLILMDHMMPEMGGDEVLSTVRRDPETYTLNINTPTIALTANAAVGLSEKYINEYGFDDYMSKPFHFRDMRAMVQKHIMHEG